MGIKQDTNYNCTMYREEMVLLGLKRRLNAPDLSENERANIINEINRLEETMDMN